MYKLITYHAIVLSKQLNLHIYVKINRSLISAITSKKIFIFKNQMIVFFIR